MKKIQHIMLVLIVLAALPGCSFKPEQTDLTQEVLLKLDASRVKEICIISTPSKRKAVPYGYEFSVRDPEKIEVMLRCMREATQIADKQPLRRSGKLVGYLVVFKTRKVWYGTHIGWNDEVVYGDWSWPTYRGRWESAELLEKFKEWNLFEEIVAADPNWPDPKWAANPPPELDPNFPPNKLPENRVGGLRPFTPAKEFTRDTLTILDFSKVRDICIVCELEDTYEVFPIEDPQKISAFLNCMKNADIIEHDKARTPYMVYFVIEDLLFYTGIGWHYSIVYGDWWKSEELAEKFNEWTLRPLYDTPLWTQTRLD